LCDNMQILAESDENRFIAYCPEHDQYQLAWERLTLHLMPEEFIQLQIMFTEIMFDETLNLLETLDDKAEWGDGLPRTSRYQASMGLAEDEMDDDEEEMAEEDEIVLWFEEVGLRVTTEEFLELASLVDQAAAVAKDNQLGYEPDLGQLRPDDYFYPFLPDDSSLFSLN
jgi:hypothetical protein